MRALLFLTTLILLLIPLGLFALWGVMTAATGMTLAADNFASQATIHLLACALVGMMLVGLPGLLYLAFRLGKVAASYRQPTDRMDSQPIIVTLPAPEIPTEALPGPSTTMLPEPRPRRRARGSLHQATRIARRWFQ